MNLDFLNDYWIHKVNANKHFEKLNLELVNHIGSRAVPEDRLKTAYRGFKKWDLHFPDKRIAIEYKTIAADPSIAVRNNRFNINRKCFNIIKNIGTRVEEALGCSKDLKDLQPDYKLGYIIVISFDRNQSYEPMEKIINNVILKTFDRMVENKVYDFFCPLITFGTDDHEELSKNYSLDKFVNEIKNCPTVEISPFAEFFI